MKFNPKICAFVLGTALSVPTLTFAQGSQKQTPTDSNVNPSGSEPTKTGPATDVLNQADAKQINAASDTSTTSRDFKERSAADTTGTAATRTTDTTTGAVTGVVGSGTQGSPALDSNNSSLNRNTSTYDATTSDRTSRGNSWGWMGLLGLTGLFGLVRRPETTDRKAYVNRSATGTI